MITPQQLGEAFALNVRLVKMQTEGLKHLDSLVQTPYNINSMNWVLGHLVVNRDRVLDLLGQGRLLTDAERARYATDSEPVKEDSDDILQLERLVELIERGQEQIVAGLEKLTPEDLARELQVGQRTVSVGRRLFGLYFHDTYHTGQTDLLRQVAGMNDKVI